jgi:hypothetical protein
LSEALQIERASDRRDCCSKGNIVRFAQDFYIQHDKSTIAQLATAYASLACAN